MIQRRTIDLLDDEDNPDLPSETQINQIDDTFIRKTQDKENEPALTTNKKFHVLDWNSIDRQLRSYGYGKVDTLSLNFIKEDEKKHIKNAESDGEFDFASDTIPFSAKYNMAFALSYSEAIGILSNNDSCEIYASEEIKKIFEKYDIPINDGLNLIDFDKLPIQMKKELVWPAVQNLYRALTVRKASQIFPEGIYGDIACEALMAECKDNQLSVHLTKYAELKYSDYDIVYFSDPSDLEVKYHIASYCLDHIREIKRRQNPEQEEPEQKQDDTENDEEKDDEKTEDDEQEKQEAIKNLENEYISAFKRINKNKSFWEKINLNDILQMGKDVIEAIREEAGIFNKLKQEIFYRLGGRSKIVIEDEELARIIQGQNPNFDMASQYLSMFFQPSDYYSILGLSNSGKITERDVKDAFKKLAKVYHPDKNPNDPYKEEKEQRFKLMLEAKDAILKKLKGNKEAITEFRDDVSLANYIGSISKLFDGYERHEEDIKQYEYKTPDQVYDKQEDIGMENTTDDTIQNTFNDDEYLGPYFEEMRILSSLAGEWKGKDILVLGAGREPEDFSIPVILAQIGANVTAIDINYNGPEEYKGCKYIRGSIDRVEQIFDGKQFDLLISTAVFGVPFTNWAIKRYSMNPFSDGFTEKFKRLELEIFGSFAKIIKKGGWQFHYNKDMNPQSWNFDENDLKNLGYESAFHPENHQNSNGIWFIKS